jgi:radical SAM protein (TIGR04043 family)
MTPAIFLISLPHFYFLINFFLIFLLIIKKVFILYGNKMRVMNTADKKMELQSRGVRIDYALEERLKGDFPTATSDYLSFMMEGAPVAMLGGFYTDSSPYEIKETEGGFGIFKEEELFSKVEFLKRPDFFNDSTSDGVAMEKLCKLVAPGFLIVYLSTGCAYWGEMQCKFCVTGHIETIKNKKPAQVAELAEAGAGEIGSHIALTSGALPKDRGSELLAETSRRIKEKVDVPLSVNSEPPKDLNMIDDMGKADSIYINMEVFDEKKRKEIMPGKSEFKAADYDRVFKRCTDTFEDNQVCSVLLAGLEEDNTYLEGVEFLAGRGVVPAVVPFYPTSLSKLNEKSPPPAERMKNLYLRSADIMKDHGLDPRKTKAGFIKGGALSALKEVMQNV